MAFSSFDEFIYSWFGLLFGRAIYYFVGLFRRYSPCLPSVIKHLMNVGSLAMLSLLCPLLEFLFCQKFRFFDTSLVATLTRICQVDLQEMLSAHTVFLEHKNERGLNTLVPVKFDH